jgi:hypothetical protein
MNLRDTRVKDVMSYSLIRACPTMEIRGAAQTMIRKKGSGGDHGEEKDRQRPRHP